MALRDERHEDLIFGSWHMPRPVLSIVVRSAFMLDVSFLWSHEHGAGAGSGRGVSLARPAFA
jgi:hypothetical protein